MSSVSSDIPREVQDVLADLTYIANLPTGHKYNVNNKTYIQANSWMGSFLTRPMASETKNGAIDFINRVISRAIDAGRKHENWRNKIQEKLQLIENALINMTHTYSVKYPDINSDVEIIQLRIDPNAYLQACLTQIVTVSNPLAKQLAGQLAINRILDPSTNSPNLPNSPGSLNVQEVGVFGSSPPARSIHPPIGDTPVLISKAPGTKYANSPKLGPVNLGTSPPFSRFLPFATTHSINLGDRPSQESASFPENLPEKFPENLPENFPENLPTNLSDGLPNYEDDLPPNFSPDFSISDQE